MTRFGPVGILGDDDGVAGVGTELLARTNGVVPLRDIVPGSERVEWLREGKVIASGRPFTVTGADVGAALTVLYSFVTRDGKHQVESKPVRVADPAQDALRELYTFGLLREPDAEGLRFWASYLIKLIAEGMDRVQALLQVMQAFTDSEDYAKEQAVRK